MTEPDGGSDFLGAMRTRAVSDGDDYVTNGTKMWVTNPNVANVAIVYAKTDPAGTPLPVRTSGRRGDLGTLRAIATPDVQIARPAPDRAGVESSLDVYRAHNALQIPVASTW